MTDTTNGRAFRHFQEPGFAPGEQFDELWRMQRLTRAEILFIRKLRITVPRADQLAVIAAVYAVADKWSKLLRNGPFQFDSEIGDAATGINGIRLNDSPRRADGHAGHAPATAFLHRAVYR